VIENRTGFIGTDSRYLLLEGCTVYSLGKQNVYYSPPTQMQKANFKKINLKVIEYAGPTSSDPVPLQQTTPYLPILTL
jgi:hypothetical protein